MYACHNSQRREVLRSKREATPREEANQGMKKRVQQVAAVMLAVIAAVMGIGGAVATVFARRVVTPAAEPPAPVTVLDVDRSAQPPTVTFTRGEDADLEGSLSFIFDGGEGHARVGHIIARDTGSVQRVLETELRGTIQPQDRGRITGWWYDSPERLGYPYTPILITSEVGDLPAWRISPPTADTDHVAIHVHGRGARREETLRGVTPVAQAGWTSIVMSYRNDADAPRSADGKYGFGVTESADVEAAIDMAVRDGATTILLVGWSMGATAVLQAAERSPHRDLIAGLILESPAIDWPDILRHQAELASIPAQVAGIGTTLFHRGSRLAGMDAPIAVAELTPERWAATLSMPVLIHVSEADTFVPPAGAIRLAELRSDLVTIRLTDQGEHVKLWNVDRSGWEHATTEFARSVRPLR